MKKLNVFTFVALIVVFATVFYFSKNQHHEQKNIQENTKKIVQHQSLTPEPEKNLLQESEENQFHQKNGIQEVEKLSIMTSEANSEIQTSDKLFVIKKVKDLEKTEIPSQSPYLLEPVLETEEAKYMKKQLDGEADTSYLFGKINFSEDQHKQIQNIFDDYVLASNTIVKNVKNTNERYFQLGKNVEELNEKLLSVLREEQKQEYYELLKAHRKKYEEEKKTEQYKKKLQIILKLDQKLKRGESTEGFSITKEEWESSHQKSEK